MRQSIRNFYSLTGLVVVLSLSACLGAPAETGLQNTPPTGVYQGQIYSTQYQESGVIYGTLNNQMSFGQPALVATLAMNLNNQVLGIFDGNLTTTMDKSNNCLSTPDSVSTNPTSASSTTGVISFSNCQLNGGVFSANYIIYKQSSGITLDSGTLTLALNPNCQLYPAVVSNLANGNYNGGFQSCLTSESSTLGGSITNSSLSFDLYNSQSSESTIAFIQGTVSSDYSLTLGESITSGNYAGYITPLYLINLNQANTTTSGNYVSYYDYGIVNLGESTTD